MMRKIYKPETGEEREVSNSVLGVWRRKGWILREEGRVTVKKHLKAVEESVVEDVSKNEEA